MTPPPPSYSVALSKEISVLQKSFSEGEVIFSEHDLSRDLYVLLRGKVEVLQQGVKLADLDKGGTFFGEMALLSGQPRSATLRAGKDAVMLQVPPDKLPLLMQQMPDLVMRIAKNLASTVSNLNKELLKAREAVSLHTMLLETMEKNPQAQLGEVLPGLVKVIRQAQHDTMHDLAKSYLRSNIFIVPFLHSVETTLQLFFDHAVKVSMDDGKDTKLPERACGVDFTGAMSGTFLFLAPAEALKTIGKKLFGEGLNENLENDTLRELARRIIEQVKVSVPGLHLELTAPQVIEHIEPGHEDALGLRLKTDVGFLSRILLNR